MKKSHLIFLLVFLLFHAYSCSSSETGTTPEGNGDDPQQEDPQSEEENPEEENPEEEDIEFRGVEDAESALTNLYIDIELLIGSQDKLLALTELTTDALVVPTRGTEWNDNGVWRMLHTHEWGADHEYITNFWNDWLNMLRRSTEIIHPNSQASVEIEAESRFFRALADYMLIDHFGVILDINLDTSQPPAVLKGSEAVDYILADLEFAIANLPSIPAGSGQALSRAGKSAAHYLKAKLLLNAFIYRQASNPTTLEMNSVIDAVNQIEAQGYALANGYFDIFRNSSDSETIWFIETSVGNRIFNTLHFNSTSIGGGGWNGFGTLAEYYDLFEGNSTENRVDESGNPLDNQEERRGGVPPSGRPFTNAPGTTDDTNGFEEGSNVGNGFLIGQQYALDGAPLTERPGNLLIFTREYQNTDSSPGITNNGESTGIRVIKYNPAYGAFENHLIFFRYADAYLMKAEALLRNGGDITNMINVLRSIRNADPLGIVGEEELLAERGRELFTECWRRNDLIRFGQFTRAWEFKAASEIGNSDKNLFPIPTSALTANPNLIQNPGY